MKLLDVVREVRRHLEENGRVSLRMLRRQYDLDDEALDELIEELIDVQRVARREENVLVWAAQPTPPTAVQQPGTARPADQPAARGVDARKVVTILFADLAGSTGLHERLDPESVNAFMENYYRAMRGAVEAHRGTVVKFLGDGVMAAFGVPRVAEDDAMRAVRAGVEMQLAFRQLAGEQSARVGDIGLRVAINTGEVVVNADNTDVVGDPVNVAARLQQEARNGDVVLGESTYRLVAALVTLEPLGSVTLKGRAETVKAYRVESLERPVGTATAAFVGRDSELGRITAVYDAALATPAARLAVLLGSPGLGKSRMIEEFTRRLGDAATVLTAQCEAAGGATFAPLAEALRELLSGNRDQVPLLTKEGSGEVGQLAKQPPPSPLLGKEGGEGTSLHAALEAALPATEAERTRIVAGIAALLAGSPASPEETFFVIRRFLAALAQTKPVVLVIDDLQWAEPLLLDLVEHLVQWGSGVPLLVLVGARPELRDLRSSLVTPGGLVADVLTLAGLDAGAAMRLAANVIGAADLPAAVAAKVLATSEGNPLFVGELVRMLVQEGALTKEGDRWIPGVALAALEMPPTIHALLAARIERLRPEERSVLERAAVVGRHFSRSAVAELLPRDVVDLDARLEALRRSELIEGDTGWFLGEPVLRFHHILIRDAAYRRLLKGTRAELHARFADWVAARAGDAADHDETIGWHLEQAHQLLRELGPLDQAGRVLGERAAQHLAAAGRRALARDDLPVAANLLGRAVERLDVDDAARADLALDWCEALLAGGDVGPAAKAIDELGRFIGEAARAPSPAHLLSVGEGRGEGTSGGDAPVAPAPGSLTLPSPALNERAGEASMRLRAWHTCFTGQLTVLTAPQKLQSAADAVAGAAGELAKLGDAAGEAKAHSVHAQALARLGKVGACEAALDQALAAARRAGDRRRANAVLAGAPLAALWGPSPVTRASGRCLDVVRVLRITQGAPAVESVALSCQGVLEALRGRTEAARRMLASSRKMVEDLGIAHRLFEADAFSGRIAAMEGDAAGAERLLRNAYDGLRDLGLGIDAARAGALLARTLLAQDRVAEAESLSHESERLAGDDLQAAIAWRGVRAEALAKRGEHAEAVELARAAVAIASTTDALLDHADARMALAAALRAAGRGTEADAEQRRAIELWEAKGATLPAERARRVDVQLPPAAAAPETRSAPGMRRRIASNRATEAHLRVEAGNTQDLFSEDYEEIDHPTGSTFGRDANFASFQRLMRSRDASLRIDLLAGLGDSLALRRRLVYASATGSSRFDVGEYENERILVLEVDERGRFLRQEVFAANSLGEAITRLYARHAELLPDGPERERAAATARSLGTMLKEARDLERVAAVIAPNFESVDHRHLSTWSMRGGAAFVEHLRALLEVAADVVIGTSELLALEPSALLIRRMHSGTERLGGGAYERPFLVLFATDAEGRLARAEWFDADREVEALARFEALAGAEALHPVRRRVRANAATRQLEREWAAIEARDVDALTALNSQVEVIHHPTGTTYGASEVLAMYRGLWRGKNIKVAQEVLATLGDSLALVRRSYSHEGIDAKFGAVGPVEGEVVCVFEVDESTQAKRSEVFAADRLGAAVARLYERFAELLPEGPERGRVAATARSVAGWNGPIGPDRLATTVTPSMELVDHRNLGTWSTRGAEFLDHTRLQTQLAIGFTGRTDGVLALAPDALLVRSTYFGIARDSGGAFENVLLQLFAFGADGLIARGELWEPDLDAEALARFDALTATVRHAGSLQAGIQEGGVDSRQKIAGMTERSQPVRRRLRPSAASAAVSRLSAAFAARDAAAAEATLSDVVEAIDHRWHATYGREGVLKTWRGMMKPQDADIRIEPIARLGDRLSLERWCNTSSGGIAGQFDVGEYASEYARLTEVDPAGKAQRFEMFAIDHLGNAITRLYERYAELLPDGPERIRAAATARSVAVWCGPPEADRLATAMAPSVENVDHRTFGTWSARGAEDYLRHWRVQEELAAGWAVRHDAVLALEANAYLVRSAYYGSLRSTGGAFENLVLALLVFGTDGLVTRTEVWEPDREAEALARFEELSETSEHLAFPLLSKEGARGRLLTRHFETSPDPSLVRRGTPTEPFANAASRTDSELFRCFNGRDWEGVLACVAPVMVFDERRRLARNTCDRDVWLEQFRFLFDVPKSRFTSHLRATRGERLALNFHRFTGEVAGGGGPLAIEDHFALHEVDADGRIVGLVLFDLEDEDAAYAELDARFEAGEGAAHPHFISSYSRAIATRDWDAIAALYPPTFLERDHRRVAVLGTTRGSEAWMQDRALIELAPDTVVRVDHVRYASRGFLSQATWQGSRDGARFEIPFLVVSELDEHGAPKGNDLYDPEQLDLALGRFRELTAPGVSPQRFGNAVTRREASWGYDWDARDWDAVTAVYAPAYCIDDRRSLMHMRYGDEAFLEQLRMIFFEVPRSHWNYECVATRGERLALNRIVFEGEVSGGGGPLSAEWLQVDEVDTNDCFTASILFDAEDIDAAYAELDARWQEGEAAAHPLASKWLSDYLRCFAARDWNAMTTLLAPELVGENHRLVGWGTLHGPAAVVSTMQAQIELAPDTQERVDHVRTCEHAVLFEYAWRGTHAGGAFENLWIVLVELDDAGRGRRADVWEAEQLDRALGRFAEIGAEERRDPLVAIAKPNLATASIERGWTAFDVLDPDATQGVPDAVRAHFAPDFVWEDRRPIVGLSGGLDLMIASLRERVASGARQERRTIVGTAGDRVAIARVLWAGGPPEGRFEVDFLVVHEVNEAGLCTAQIFFDPDDERTAQREAWARWAAIDPVAAPWVELVNEFTEAWNGHDRARVRACCADDFVLEDDRHAGLGRIEGAEAYVDSIVVLWDLAPDQRLMFGWSWPVVERHGIVVTIRRQGTVPDGGPFESEHLALGLARNGRFTRVEFFEIDALDAALARFEELRPDPLRVPPNAATRALDRQKALAEAGDWKAVRALHSPRLVFDDRRPGLRTTTDGDAYLAGLRWAHGAAVARRPELTSTVLATAGDRLDLRHNRFSRTEEETLVFEIETLALAEIDADGLLAAIVLFDPADRAAAEAELFERYVASGGDGMPRGMTEYFRGVNEGDLARARTGLCDDFVLEDRRRTGMGRLEGGDTYIASVAVAHELTGELHVRPLYTAAIAPHGRVVMIRAAGTNTEGGAFESYCAALVLYRGERIAAFEFFEPEELDAALARLAECAGAVEATKPR